MESAFTPIAEVIEGNDIYKEHVIDVVNNFISSFRVSSKTIALINSDKEFIRLLKALISILHNSQVTEEYSLPLNIVKFLIELSNCTNIIEIIAKEINIDLLINTFFGTNAQKTVDNYNIYFHFLSLLATTKFIIFSKQETVEVLFSIIFSMIHTKETQYWAIMLIALLSRNNTSFSSFMKMNHDFNQLKSEICELLASEDRSIMGAAFSASIALNPFIDEFESAVVAAKKLAESENTNELFLYSLSLAISDLESKDKVGNDCYAALFIALLRSHGIDAYGASKVLCNLDPSYSKSLTPSEIRAFILYLIQCEESYTSMSCCALLYTLVDSIPDIFVIIENPFELFRLSLKNFKQIALTSMPERFQSLLYVMRLLVNSPGIKAQASTYLQLNEEFLFMEFQRRIELEDAVLSTSFFHFLMECSLFMEGWNQRIRKCIIDSKFPTLLCSTVISSRNKREISGSLLAMQLLLTDSTTQYIFFEQFTSSIQRINSQSYDGVENALLDIEKEKKSYATLKRDYVLKIEELEHAVEEKQVCIDEKEKESKAITSENRSHMEENKVLQEKIEELSIVIHQLQKENHSLQHKLEKTASDNIKLSKKIIKYKNQIEPLKDVFKENEELTAKLKIAENKINVLLTTSGVMEAQLAKFKDSFTSVSNDVITKGKANAALEVQLSEAKAQLNSNDTTIRDMTHQLECHRVELNELKDALSSEKKKSITYNEAAKQLNAENKELRIQKSKNAEQIESQKSQIDILKQTIAQLKKDNRRLGGIATFDKKIHNAQNITVHDLFGSTSV